MEPWCSILASVGCNAVTLGVLAWLARSFGSQLLAKDLEKFKADLSATSSSASERLKHELQLTALEHQVTFSKLHERRAEVIAELYGLLVEVQWASQSLVSMVGWSAEPSEQEKYAVARNKIVEFYRYFVKNRIYLPETLCTQAETLVNEMQSRVIQFGVYISADDQHAPEHVIKERFEVWRKAAEYFDKEAPLARTALETELRSILGSGTRAS
jgi:hypothetical protein